MRKPLEATIGADTTTFTVQNGLIQFLTLPSETWKNSWELQAAIFNEKGGFDTTITSAQIVRFDSTGKYRLMMEKLIHQFFFLKEITLLILKPKFNKTENIRYLKYNS